MEDTIPIIISDEEAGFGDTRKGNSYSGDGFGDRDDHDWLSEILSEVDRSKDDDSDDVVLVSEVFANSKKSNLEYRKYFAKIAVDDDCVVLDGDPEKPLVVVVGSGRADDDDDSDDLEIIGEKGEVACRDFPHPRHLCAKLPFASTSHNLHCPQCHCYVCDSLAPCASWGTGISSIDHCHASDKVECWKAERKCMKKLNNPTPVVPHTIDTYFSSRLHQTTQIPPPPNSFLHNQGLRSVNIPSVIDQGRGLPSGCVIPRCKRQPQLVPQNLHTSSHINIPSRGKIGNSGPRFVSPRAVFKRPGYDKNNYGSLLSRDPSLNRCHSVPHPFSNHSYSSNIQNTPSQAAEVVPRPLSSFSQSINVRNVNYAHSQPQMTSQPCLSGNYVNVAPFQSHVASQPNLGKFDNMIFSQPDIVFQPNDPIPSQSMINTFQCEEFGNSASLSIDGQHNFQQRRQIQSAVDTNATDFSFNWHENLHIPTEVSQLQSIEAADIDNTLRIKDTGWNVPESTNSDPLDFDLESLMFEDRSLPGALEVLVSSGMNWNLFL